MHRTPIRLAVAAKTRVTGASAAVVELGPSVTMHRPPGQNEQMNTPSSHHGVDVGVLIIAICLLVSVVASGCSKTADSQAQSDAKSLFAALHNEVKPGDTIERVQAILGRGVSRPNSEKRFAARQEMAKRYPQSYPDGVQKDDVFVRYTFGDNVGVALQFREGRLINFDPKQFEKVPKFVGLGSK